MLRTWDRAWVGIPYVGPMQLRAGDETLSSVEAIRKAGNTPAPIEFLGLWDTVDAYGLPIEEMTKAWDDYIWPLSMRDRDLSPIVKRARHALALDDERNTFHPVLWNEKKEGMEALPLEERRIVQVWFSGMHSNVGGGYPIDSLSHVSLSWMIDEIDRRKHPGFGLSFIPERITQYCKDADPLGPMKDSRQGLGAYYRYQPRRFALLARKRVGSIFSAVKEGVKRAVGKMRDQEAVPDLPGPELTSPIIHHSVLKRIAARVDNYAPFVIPRGASVLLPDGRLEPDIDRHCAKLGLRLLEDQSVTREEIDNWVWLRRVVYFSTLLFTLLFAFMPFYADIENTDGNDRTTNSLISAIPEGLAGMLPGFMKPWIDSWAANPGMFLSFVLFIIALNIIGTLLKDTINARAGRMWKSTPHPRLGLRPAFIDRAVGALRRSQPYIRLFRWLKGAGLPFVFFLLFVFAAIGGLSRIYFSLFSKPDGALPNYCAPGVPVENLIEGSAKTIDHAFDSRCPYWNSGVNLAGGARYRVEMVAQPAPRLESGSVYTCWSPFAGKTTGARKAVDASSSPTWWDAGYAADLYGLADVQGTPGSFAHGLRLLKRHLTYFPGLLLRRNVTQPWFTLHARFGTEGRAEIPLLPLIPPKSAAGERHRLVAEFTAKRGGPLYLYVNDGINLPCLNFYANNQGRAQVSITWIGWDATFNK